MSKDKKAKEKKEKKSNIVPKHNLLVRKVGKTSPREEKRLLWGIASLEDNEPFERGVAFVNACIAFLTANKANEQEGIFRKAGSEKRLKELVAICEKQSSYQFQKSEDIHVVANLFKRYFREMQEPLLTFKNYSTFVAAVGEMDVAKRMQNIEIALACLPPHNLAILNTLLQYLNELAKSSAHTFMDSKNLAIVFGPNLLRPKVETPIILITDAGHVAELISILIERGNSSKLDQEPQYSAQQLDDFKKTMRANYSTQTMTALQALRKAKELDSGDSPFIGKLELIGKKIKAGDRKTVQHFFDQEIETPAPEAKPAPYSPAPFRTTEERRKHMAIRKMTGRKWEIDSVLAAMVTDLEVVTPGNTTDDVELGPAETTTIISAPPAYPNRPTSPLPAIPGPAEDAGGEEVPRVIIKKSSSTENVPSNKKTTLRRVKTDTDKDKKSDDSAESSEVSQDEVQKEYNRIIANCAGGDPDELADGDPLHELAAEVSKEEVQKILADIYT